MYKVPFFTSKSGHSSKLTILSGLVLNGHTSLDQFMHTIMYKMAYIMIFMSMLMGNSRNQLYLLYFTIYHMLYLPLPIIFCNLVTL